MARLVRHSWPGNVRELRNVIERACLLARGSTINLEDALVSEAAPSLGIRTDLPFKEAKGQLVEMFEREYIEDLMRRHKMNLSAAAREAQIDRKHLRELIRKYGLDPRHKLEGDEVAPADDETTSRAQVEPRDACVIDSRRTRNDSRVSLTTMSNFCWSRSPRRRPRRCGGPSSGSMRSVGHIIRSACRRRRRSSAPCPCT